MQKIVIPEKKFQTLSFPSYQVSFERITNSFSKVFSPSELNEYLSLYERSQKEPKKTKIAVEEFQKKYPNLPEIYNLLSYVYIKLRKIKKVEKLTKENYKKNPQHLFAKINYADQCLRKNKIKDFLEIFDKKTQLSDLYPSRRIFHYSEIIGFMCLMGFYHQKIGEKEIALDYCEYAKLIDPDDQTVLLLSRKLHQANFIQRIIRLFKPKS